MADSPPDDERVLRLDHGYDFSGQDSGLGTGLKPNGEAVDTQENVEKIVAALHEDRCCIVYSPCVWAGKSGLLAMLADALHHEYEIAILAVTGRSDAAIRRAFKEATTKDSVIFLSGISDRHDDATLLLIDDADLIPEDVLRHYCQNGTHQCVLTCRNKMHSVDDRVDLASFIHYSSGRNVKSASDSDDAVSPPRVPTPEQ